MACVPLPKVVPPALPAPFSIPLPPIPQPPKVNFCCKLPQIPQIPNPIKIPPQNPAILAKIRAGVAVVLAYLDAQEIPCPRE